MSDASVATINYNTTPWPRRSFGVMFWVIIGILAIGLFFALLVPTMCRSREPANRIKSASNLRQLGLALKHYADDHHGVMPQSWADLVLSGSDLTSDVFVSPSSNDDRASGKSPSEWAGALEDPEKHCCSYRYLADGTNRAAMRDADVVAIEPIEVHDGQGGNVLYASGAVDWLVTAKGSASEKAYASMLAGYSSGNRPVHLGQ